MMEERLYLFLKSEGINQSTIDVLVAEEVFTFKIFTALKDEHFFAVFKAKSDNYWSTFIVMGGLA